MLLLAEYFLTHFRRLAEQEHADASRRAARQKLLSHHWPGNVRELRNVIERALILETDAAKSSPAACRISSSRRRLHKTAAPRLTGAESLDEMMANFERELITSMLEQNHFNLTRTAEQLKISRHALRYRMQRLNLATEAEGEEPAGPGAKEGSV